MFRNSLVPLSRNSLVPLSQLCEPDLKGLPPQRESVSSPQVPQVWLRHLCSILMWLMHQHATLSNAAQCDILTAHATDVVSHKQASIAACGRKWPHPYAAQEADWLVLWKVVSK